MNATFRPAPFAWPAVSAGVDRVAAQLSVRPCRAAYNDRMTSWRAMVCLFAAALWLGGCINAYFDGAPQADGRGDLHRDLSRGTPSSARCRNSTRNRASAPKSSSGGPGGHSVLYLNGVCRGKTPAIRWSRCATTRQIPGPDEGVGLSVNAHYQNANWIATEGRDFVYARRSQARRTGYQRTICAIAARAKAMGILDGVVFHHEVFKDQPAGMSGLDFMYAMSDRDRLCASILAATAIARGSR